MAPGRIRYPYLSPREQRRDRYNRREWTGRSPPWPTLSTLSTNQCLGLGQSCTRKLGTFWDRRRRSFGLRQLVGSTGGPSSVSWFSVCAVPLGSVRTSRECGRKRARDQCAAEGRRCSVLASQGRTAHWMASRREKENRGGRAAVALGLAGG
jgi:hypothetical protein